jgi:hypothetical protein
LIGLPTVFSAMPPSDFQNTKAQPHTKAQPQRTRRYTKKLNCAYSPAVLRDSVPP